MLRFAASIFNNLRITLRSIIGAGIDGFLGHDHDYEWYEVWANKLSYNYFNKRDYAFTYKWNEDNSKYPRKYARGFLPNRTSFYYYLCPFGFGEFVPQNSKFADYLKKMLIIDQPTDDNVL